LIECLFEGLSAKYVIKSRTYSLATCTKDKDESLIIVVVHLFPSLESFCYWRNYYIPLQNMYLGGAVPLVSLGSSGKRSALMYIATLASSLLYGNACYSVLVYVFIMHLFFDILLWATYL